MATMSRRNFLTVAGATALAALPSVAQADGPSYSIQGFDISHWQGTIDWKRFNATPYKFAFCKATEGQTYRDPKFAANYRGMKSAGLIRGAYHFGRPGSDPVVQANHFIDTVKPMKGDLQLVLDLETTDGKTPAQVRAWTEAFLGRVQARTGRPGIIYTGFYFWRDQAGNGANLNCPLWLAAYVTNPASYVPAAWTTWSFWQYTSSGSVAGISGNVDRNAWNGTLANLNNLRLP